MALLCSIVCLWEKCLIWFQRSDIKSKPSKGLQSSQVKTHWSATKRHFGKIVSHLWRHRAWYSTWPPVFCGCWRQRNKSPNQSDSPPKGLVLSRVTMHRYYLGTCGTQRSGGALSMLKYSEESKMFRFCGNTLTQANGCIVEFQCCNKYFCKKEMLLKFCDQSTWFYVVIFTLSSHSNFPWWDK